MYVEVKGVRGHVGAGERKENFCDEGFAVGRKKGGDDDHLCLSRTGHTSIVWSRRCRGGRGRKREGEEERGEKEKEGGKTKVSALLSHVVFSVKGLRPRCHVHKGRGEEEKKGERGERPYATVPSNSIKTKTVLSVVGRGGGKERKKEKGSPGLYGRMSIVLRDRQTAWISRRSGEGWGGGKSYRHVARCPCVSRIPCSRPPTAARGREGRRGGKRRGREGK